MPAPKPKLVQPSATRGYLRGDLVIMPSGKLARVLGNTQDKRLSCVYAEGVPWPVVILARLVRPYVEPKPTR
jgi:hypothetical protein